ncbi:MAG: hypothetical protein QM669_01250 [Siphonobacter sp.]
MGKRLLRISNQLLAQKLPSLVGTPLHIILQSGVTFHGTLISTSPTHLTLQDGLLQKRTYPFEQINEIIYDEKAAF